MIASTTVRRSFHSKWSVSHKEADDRTTAGTSDNARLDALGQASSGQAERSVKTVSRTDVCIIDLLSTVVKAYEFLESLRKTTLPAEYTAKVTKLTEVLYYTGVQAQGKKDAEEGFLEGITNLEEVTEHSGDGPGRALVGWRDSYDVVWMSIDSGAFPSFWA